MAQQPRREYRAPAPPAPPAAPAPPPTAAPAAAPPPGLANGGNGDSSQPNMIDAEQIFADGVNAADALAAILGEDNVTGNNQVDCRAAMQAIDEWLANLDARRAVILHLMFNDYARRGENRARHQRNNWVWVAGQVRHPMATVSKWAHKVECYDTIDSDQS
jgi:hypothetical protein